jgi:hypothetical protein
MTNVNDNVRISDNIGVVASSSSKQLSSIRTLSLPFFILNILFCAIVLYLLVYHVCFQDGTLCLLVANDKLDGK